MKRFLGSLITAASVAVVMIATGCGQTRGARIRENPELFAALAPFEQSVIREGMIRPGFSSEMVTMSLGRPNRVRSGDAPEGHVEIWSYRNFVYTTDSAVFIGNAPGLRQSQTTLMSSSAKGGPSLFSTKAGPWQPQVSDDSSNSVGTLHVQLLDGYVVAALIERH